jgi:60 kDa SS-A/Ro ribonucleoprotein
MRSFLIAPDGGEQGHATCDEGNHRTPFSETWFGSIHPAQALRQYRETTGIDAKLIVVGMLSNGFRIADPRDAGMLDVVGFDATAPAAISEFARS